MVRNIPTVVSSTLNMCPPRKDMRAKSQKVWTCAARKLLGPWVDYVRCCRTFTSRVACDKSRISHEPKQSMDARQRVLTNDRSRGTGISRMGNEGNFPMTCRAAHDFLDLGLRGTHGLVMSRNLNFLPVGRNHRALKSTYHKFYVSLLMVFA